MKSLRKIGLLGFMLGAVFVCLNSNIVFAEETGTSGIQISPTIERSGLIEPGEVYKNKILIYNTGDRPIDYHMGVDPFSVEDITYAPIYSVKNAYTQVVNWISFEDYESHLEPGEMEEVNYTINIPKDAPGGGQYAVIYAEVDSIEGDEDSVKALAKGGMLLTMRVDGVTRLTGEIVETVIPGFLLAPPVSATATFKNTGNVDADARMTIKIENYFSGELIYDGSNDPLEKTILPDTTRDLNISWSNVPRLGILKITLNTEFMGDAEVKTRIVVVCPIWFMAIIILIVLVIIFRILAKRREERRTRTNSRNTHGSSGNLNL